MSLETDGIIRYLMSTGVAFKVTDISTPGVHAEHSYHYAQGTGGIGLAVDVAGLVPSWDSPEMDRIYEVLKPVAGRCAELLYRVAGHHDHIHIAVPRGTVLKKAEVGMPDNAELFNIKGPVSFYPCVDSAGICQGYYIFSNSSGELHSYGPGAKYYGRSEVV